MTRTKSSTDLSIAYFCVLIVGFALWLAYGLAIGNAALIVPNSVALVIATATIAVASWYRR
jgi:MtN3 and saliva related transmembrane protein